jgi:hypothetical protein
MHLDAHPVVEQNASVIAQTNPGPAFANDGIYSAEQAGSRPQDTIGGAFSRRERWRTVSTKKPVAGGPVSYSVF